MSYLPFLQRLELGEDADERAIRRAYAVRLKLIDQEADPAGFQSLRETYDAALYWARNRALFDDGEPAEPALIAEATDAAEFAEAANQRPASGQSPPPVFRSIDMDDEALRGQYEQAATEHEALADAVFAEFTQRAAGIADERPISADLPWRRELQRSLDDSRLVNIIERDGFERRVAELLDGGWQPGHEALLVAAVKVFGWSDDRRRVLSLGPAGARLDAAIDERATFDMQSAGEHEQQRQLIERLRSAKPPGARELVKYGRTLETLIARFPNWLVLITSLHNIMLWRERNATLPAWRRRLTFGGWRREPGPSYEKAERGVNWVWMGLMLLIFLIRLSSCNSNYHSEPSSSRPPVVDAQSYIKLGTQQLNAGDANSAIISFTRALGMSPDNREAYARRAMAYLNVNEDQLAGKDLTSWTSSAPPAY